ncbi:MAG: bifunctional adenosylcobinamide kinase/adenosylcobinamide-phosphate guanylyltransferase [Eubacterium sp.]|nr:bifunctional adenosylcobinamide kinase/adenosylcobinamide-phosphate guanylyltransferase [Eubacterium sp.]
MLRLVIGGSASGKSEYAEQLILSLSEGETVDYIATMKCSDEELEKRIEIHKERREGTAFHTIEKPDKLSELDTSGLHEYGMLECVSNLLANEMFSGWNDEAATEADEDEPAECLAKELITLARHYKEFVIVTNDIFEDSIVFDEVTKKYVGQLGRINRLLTEEAESVTEVVCGIPVRIK